MGFFFAFFMDKEKASNAGLNDFIKDASDLPRTRPN